MLILNFDIDRKTELFKKALKRARANGDKKKEEAYIRNTERMKKLKEYTEKIRFLA